ncbi:hypothetical protein MTR67_019333, partial [Solanum verrucosum]
KFGFPYLVETPRSEKRRSASMAGHISDEDSENITREDPSMEGPRASRSVIESGHPSIKNIMTVDDNLLVLCHDSGMKGCWFKSKVIQELWLMLGDLTGEGKVLLLDLIFVEALIFSIKESGNCKNQVIPNVVALLELGPFIVVPSALLKILRPGNINVTSLEVNLKMTASIDIKSNNNTFPPPVRPPSIHCSSYFKRLVKIILQKLGPNCEVSGASHAQSIKAYNSVERNPFLLTKQRMDSYNHVFSSWEGHVVSQGKGCRVVHHYLKDSSGELILVVV